MVFFWWISSRTNPGLPNLRRAAAAASAGGMPRAMLSAVSVSRYAAISRARSSSHHRRLRNRRQLMCASLLRRPQHLVDGAHDPFPAAHFHAQLLAPGRREAVVARLAVVLRSAPE